MLTPPRRRARRRARARSRYRAPWLRRAWAPRPQTTLPPSLLPISLTTAAGMAGVTRKMLTSCSPREEAAPSSITNRPITLRGTSLTPPSRRRRPLCVAAPPGLSTGRLGTRVPPLGRLTTPPRRRKADRQRRGAGRGGAGGRGEGGGGGRGRGRGSDEPRRGRRADRRGGRGRPAAAGAA